VVIVLKGIFTPGKKHRGGDRNQTLLHRPFLPASQRAAGQRWPTSRVVLMLAALLLALWLLAPTPLRYHYYAQLPLVGRAGSPRRRAVRSREEVSR